MQAGNEYDGLAVFEPLPTLADIEPGGSSPASTDVGDRMQTDEPAATAVDARRDTEDCRSIDGVQFKEHMQLALGSTIWVSKDARERVARMIGQLDKKARVLFKHTRPAWQGLGGKKPAKWESLQKTYFRDKPGQTDKAFTKPGKGSGGAGRTQLCFKDSEVESSVAARATKILERLEEGSPVGLSFPDGELAAENLTALLYSIAKFPDRVRKVLAEDDVIGQHKRGRPVESRPQRTVSGENIQGESGNAGDGYLTCKKDGEEVGRIADSDNGKGIKLESASGDFAEWHPVARGEAPFQAGDLVGLRRQPGGTKLHISRHTHDAEMLAVISRQAIVEGSKPPAAEQDKSDKVAYAGRVPVKLQVGEAGKSELGQLVFPSGKNDGTGTTSGSCAIRCVGAIDSIMDESMVQITVRNPFETSLSLLAIQEAALHLQVKESDSVDCNEGFVGRAQELRRMSDTLNPSGTAVVVISGDGGLGKTTLANRYADVNAARYNGWVFHFDGSGDAVQVEHKIMAALAEHPTLLSAGIPPPKQNDFPAFMAWCTERCAGRCCLFLGDNVYDGKVTSQFVGDKRDPNTCHWHTILTTRRNAVKIELEAAQVNGSTPIAGIPLQILEEEDRAQLLRGSLDFSGSPEDSEALAELISKTGPLRGITLFLETCGKLLELAGMNPRTLLAEVEKQGTVRGLQQSVDESGIPFPEISQYSSLFGLSFGILDHLAKSDNNKLAGPAKLATFIAKLSGVFASAGLPRLLLLRAASKFSKKKRWYQAGQPSMGTAGSNDEDPETPFTEKMFKTAASLLFQVGLSDRISSDGSLHFHDLRRDLARDYLKSSQDAGSFERAGWIALASLQEFDLPTEQSKIDLLQHMRAVHPSFDRSEITMDKYVAKAVILKANITYSMTKDCCQALEICLDCMVSHGLTAIDKIGEAIFLNGISFLLRRFGKRGVEKYKQWTESDLPKRMYREFKYGEPLAAPDDEAFALARRSMLAWWEHFGCQSALSFETTEVDPLGVVSFVGSIEAFATGLFDTIQQKLDSEDVIDFTNTPGNLVEHVRKIDIHAAMKLRRLGVHETRKALLGPKHSATTSTQYHLARLQIDAGQYADAIASLREVYAREEELCISPMLLHKTISLMLGAAAKSGKDSEVQILREIEPLVQRSMDRLKAHERELLNSTTAQDLDMVHYALYKASWHRDLFDEALIWAQKKLESCKTDSRYFLARQHDVGACLRRVHQYDEAVKMLTEVYEGRAKNGQDFGGSTLNSLQELAAAYHGQRNWKKEIELLELLVSGYRTKSWGAQEIPAIEAMIQDAAKEEAARAKIEAATIEATALKTAAAAAAAGAARRGGGMFGCCSSRKKV